MKYQWNGRLIKVEFGTAKIKENKQKPLYWFNFECNWDLVFYKPKYSSEEKFIKIPAIRITTEDGKRFMISNHFGIGYNKITKGGCIDQTHFHVPENSKFTLGHDDLDRDFAPFKKFNYEKWYQHESKRREWQMYHFPEEYKKKQALLEAIKNSKRLYN